LDLAFELEGVVIGALGFAGVIAACFGASFVDGAAAGLGVEELAGAIEEVVFAPAEDTAAVFVDGELLFGLLQGEPEMQSEALDVFLGDLDAFVNGAAESDAFGAIVGDACSCGGHIDSEVLGRDNLTQGREFRANRAGGREVRPASGEFRDLCPGRLAQVDLREKGLGERARRAAWGI